jgi:hypothetical protein
LLFILLLPLAACGTVSMVSGQALVETSFAAEKSSLEKVCDSYNQKARDAHWVAPSGGLFGLARTLVDGDRTDEDGQDAYLEAHTIQQVTPERALSQIVDDVTQARAGLEIVTDEARMTVWTATLNGFDLRSEMMSFETVLVTAQRSRRTFVSASQVVRDAAGQAALDMSAFETALGELDRAIDGARETVDLLAAAYAPEPDTTPGLTS